MKICVVGEFAVGKTTLIKRFVKSYFNKEYIPTIGANLYQKTVSLKSKGEVYEANLNIWDIAGQQSWKFMQKPYLGGAQGVFIVGDLTRRETFNELINTWLVDLRKIVQKDIPIILLANKSDLTPKYGLKNLNNFLSQAKIKQYFITSAKSGMNLFEAFQELVKEILGLEEITPI
jgi:small GTP-binding protein